MDKRVGVVVVLIGACAGMLGGFLPSVQADWEAEETFRALDTNGDGRITKDEGPKVYNWTPGLFEIKDLNSDGGITLTEFTTWLNAPRTKALADKLSETTFTAMDSNKDGKIHRQDEWIGTTESFQKKDLNNDGLISKEEATGTRAN